MSRERPSHLAVVPNDVTDRLLWRLALDVTAAHQPGEDGRCHNPQCTDQLGPCAASVNARRAMNLARRTPPAPRQPAPPTARGRATVPTRQQRAFASWFTRPTPAPTRCPPARLPHRLPGAALASAA